MGCHGTQVRVLEWVNNGVGILKGNGVPWGIMLGGHRVMKRFRRKLSEG